MCLNYCEPDQQKREGGRGRRDQLKVDDSFPSNSRFMPRCAAMFGSSLTAGWLRSWSLMLGHGLGESRGRWWWCTKLHQQQYHLQTSIDCISQTPLDVPVVLVFFSLSSDLMLHKKVPTIWATTSSEVLLIMTNQAVCHRTTARFTQCFVQGVAAGFESFSAAVCYCEPQWPQQWRQQEDQDL